MQLHFCRYAHKSPDSRGRSRRGRRKMANNDVEMNNKKGNASPCSSPSPRKRKERETRFGSLPKAPAPDVADSIAKITREPLVSLEQQQVGLFSSTYYLRSSLCQDRDVDPHAPPLMADPSYLLVPAPLLLPAPPPGLFPFLFSLLFRVAPSRSLSRFSGGALLARREM